MDPLLHADVRLAYRARIAARQTRVHLNSTFILLGGGWSKPSPGVFSPVRGRTPPQRFRVIRLAGVATALFVVAEGSSISAPTVEFPDAGPDLESCGKFSTAFRSPSLTS